MAAARSRVHLHPPDAQWHLDNGHLDFHTRSDLLDELYAWHATWRSSDGGHLAPCSSNAKPCLCGKPVPGYPTPAAEETSSPSSLPPVPPSNQSPSEASPSSEADTHGT